MIQSKLVFLATTTLLSGVLGTSCEGQAWASWRGPDQNGTSRETGLPGRVDPAGAWSCEVSGRGTPVVFGGSLYCMGYRGEGVDLHEMLLCLDPATGAKRWEHRFREFLTDSIYYRFAIGSPTVDPGSGHVFCLTTAGLLSSFTKDGALRWQRSLMSEYGRLTFPNGRTGAPLVVDDKVIIHTVTSAWGPHAPARDRFYAFEADTGIPIWTSTPGGPPKDVSFSFPVVATENGRKVMYAGLGGGFVVCVDVPTGDPLWRFPLATGGLSASPVLFGDWVITTHGKENLDSSAIGRMVAIKRGAEPEPGKGPVTLGRQAEAWRNHLVAFTSSPVLVGDRVYLTVSTGELACVDAVTGRILWEHKLAPDQIHASPVWGDGKLYVPMNNGSFFIVEPADSGPKVLQEVKLAGNCLGAPAIADGRVYVHTTSRLYCFAGEDTAPAAQGALAVRLQVIPGDISLRPGEEVPLRVRSLDRLGNTVSPDVEATWSGLPKGVSTGRGMLSVARDAPPGAVAVRCAAGELVGSARLRIVQQPSWSEDFERFSLREHSKEPGVLWAPPPIHWVSAGKKWEVRELDGQKLLAKTLDMPLFQRTMTLIGHPAQSGYTIEADIYSDGNRRTMCSAGLINQRYLILLKGNHQALEVSSNVDLLKESVPFRWRAKTWYRLKTRVDVGEDGAGVIRGKVWKRGDPEPSAWTIKVTHDDAHRHGAPGIFGFTPQSRFRVYLDNISVSTHE